MRQVRFSTRSVYGLRAMFVLAQHYGRGALSVSTIAEREAISLAYLEQLFHRLRKQGLVDSIRGPKGGYLLAKDPQVIRIGEIVRALDGDLLRMGERRRPSKDGHRSQQVVTRVVWERLHHKLTELLDETRLSDLTASSQDARIEHKYTFHI